MLRKKVVFLLGIIVLSMFLFILHIKTEAEIVELSPTADVFTEERGFGIQITVRETGISSTANSPSASILKNI